MKSGKHIFTHCDLYAKEKGCANQAHPLGYEELNLQMKV